jgi:magnesium chelatase subunit D
MKQVPVYGWSARSTTCSNRRLPLPPDIAMGRHSAERWHEALHIAACVATDPVGLGGAVLRARAGPVRDAWLDSFRLLLPAATPWKRITPNIADARLTGGLDLAQTLAQQHPVLARGVLAEADGGVVVLAMAERASGSHAAQIGIAVDRGHVRLERDGLSADLPAKFGLLLLDEGADENEGAPLTLVDRVAFRIPLDGIAATDCDPCPWTADDIAGARERLPMVAVDDETIHALCGATATLGIASLRAASFALRAAKAIAALDGRTCVEAEHATLAAQWVCSHRATQLPAPAEEEQDAQPEQSEEDAQSAPPEQSPEQDTNTQKPDDGRMDDMLLEAVKAVIPAELLAALHGTQVVRAGQLGHAGATRVTSTRGRPIGARRAPPRDGARVSVLDTLRAAAPWQRLRARERRADVCGLDLSTRLDIRREDFHVKRYKQQTESTIIFAVDASGSAALNRLAEAKGAVELLLADCYVRRDRVAMLSFRGRAAELLLPPTRSLVRAKRSLAGLPGGGATPLASAIELSHVLADQSRRRGETPIVVFLSDGRANMSRDGTPGRAQAETEALTVARLFAASRATTLFIDTAPQPQAGARAVAAAMRATYIALPYADAGALSTVVRAEAGRAVRS